MSLMVVFCMLIGVMFGVLVVFQPLSLGVMVVLMSVVSSFFIGSTVSCWYGYMLFMVYVGGLLVMFIYVASLAANLMFVGGMGVMGCFLVLLGSGTYWMSLGKSSYVSVVGYFGDSEFVSLVGSSGGGIMEKSMVWGYVGLGALLLVVLVGVVKICYHCDGPLRPFSLYYA
uniref:NADH dehydrogenase subunit 6 n=1 Tax=Allonautilus scrobiculatus TaxID=34575 RepID=A0A0F6QQ64_9MOLL|nr:NADH dehydrogenase subunit 6 [Allonautilus scrobiculatus]AKE32142.1 NADH dehydrogenase subunit 6 [Allonautilus scrobiculatus]